MGLDQQVVNLAKSIRQVETGNRPVSGASGELASRYQYMPATWKSTAQKYLGDANAELTLENENKATYLKIKDWKDSGLGPDQIASMWNSGKPNWEGNVGTNSAGVKYDVPGYVKKVGAEYQKRKTVKKTLPIPAEHEGLNYTPVPNSVEPEKKEGFLESIISPFTRTAASAVRSTQGAFGLGKASLQALGGDKESAKNTIFDTAETVKKPLFGQQAVQNIREGIGTGFEVGSYLVPAGKASAVGKGLLKGAFGQAIKTGAKVGGISGGLYGAGTAIRENQPLPEAIKTTAKGTAFGLAAGAAIPVAGSVLSKGFKGVTSGARKVGAGNATKELESIYNNIFRSTKSGTKALTKSRSAGKNPSKFLSEKGYFIDIKQSKIDTTKVVGKLKDDLDPLNKLISSKLRTSKVKVSLKQLEKETIDKLDNATNKAEGTVTSRIKETKKIFAEFRKAYGNKINLSNLNEVKVAQAKVSGIFDSTKPKWAQDVNYQISKVARRNIEKSLKGTPLAKLNAFIGEHYDSIRMLEKVHGNAAKGGRLGQYFGRTVGAVAGGTAGGPVGVIVGSELGNKIAKILTELSAGNPLLKKAIARITRGTPEVVSRFLEGIKKTDPKIYKELVEELGFTPTKALLKAKPGDIKKLLPAGSSKPSAFSPKKTPSKTINKKNNTFIKML